MSQKISKKDLIKTVHDLGLNKAESERVIDAITNQLISAFKSATRVELRGFGSFTPKVRLGGKRRNPSTGEEVYVTDSLAVRFKLSKEHTKIK